MDGHVWKCVVWNCGISLDLTKNSGLLQSIPMQFIACWGLICSCCPVMSQFSLLYPLVGFWAQPWLKTFKGPYLNPRNIRWSSGFINTCGFTGFEDNFNGHLGTWARKIWIVQIWNQHKMLQALVLDDDIRWHLNRTIFISTIPTIDAQKIPGVTQKWS